MVLAVGTLWQLIAATVVVLTLAAACRAATRGARRLSSRPRLVDVQPSSTPAFPADLPLGVAATVSSVALVAAQVRALRRRGLRPHGLLVHQVLVGTLIAPELGAFTLWCRSEGLTLRVTQAVPADVLTYLLDDGDWQLSWPLFVVPLTDEEGRLIHLRECSAGDILRARAPMVWTALGGRSVADSIPPR